MSCPKTPAEALHYKGKGATKGNMPRKNRLNPKGNTLAAAIAACRIPALADTTVSMLIPSFGPTLAGNEHGKSAGGVVTRFRRRAGALDGRAVLALFLWLGHSNY
jgi:hypothetical protein